MSNFPSKLSFVSLLQYAPQGVGDTSRLSQILIRGIKEDRSVQLQRDGSTQIVNPITRGIERLLQQKEKNEFLKNIFDGKAVAVPLPRSSLIKADSVWAGLSISKQLVEQGLCSDVLPLVKRIKAIRKSSMAKKGERPSPSEHFESTNIDERPSLFSPSKIVLVDDVITRGSTFVGIFPHIQSLFPEASISCFAFVRTMSDQEIDSIVSPVTGAIQFAPPNNLRREP